MLVEKGCLFNSRINHDNHAHSPLYRLMPELIILISSYLDESSKAALAMTSSKFYKKIKYKKNICYHAAQHGHLALFKWGRALKGEFRPHAYAHLAAMNGHLPILEYIQSIGIKLTEKLPETAAYHSQFDILDWCHENKIPFNVIVSNFLALKGHFEKLKWAHQKGAPLSPKVCEYAALKGNLEMLKWARENGANWNEAVLEKAAFKGRVNIIEWAVKNKAPITPYAAANAAMNGHLEALSKIRELSLPWNELVCIYAARFDQLKVLEWAIQNGAPHSIGELIHTARLVNQKEIVAWLQALQKQKLR
ncbi:MAG: ankyrin repeat domain-containing protein [Parachlamydiaceae bacterium]